MSRLERRLRNCLSIVRPARPGRAAARHCTLALLSLLCSAAAAFADAKRLESSPAGRDTAAGQPCLRLGERLSLPGDLANPRDLRWSGEREIVVSDSVAGVFALKLGGIEPARETSGARAGEQLVAASREGNQIWIPWELARSQSHLAVGGAVHELGWRVAGGAPRVGVDGKAAYETVFDLDLRGSRLLVLGARWEEPTRDGFVADGALAWVGDLARGHDALRPTYFSSQGKGAKNAANCILAGLGRARFLDDGGYLIVPQFEDGIYLYGADGRLARTWKGAELGLDVGCEMSKQEAERLALEESARWGWVNARRTVDEILPTPEGFALFVRRVGPQGTSWSLERVSRDGGVANCQLPLTSSSPHAHLRADVRNGELALLLFTLERDVAPSSGLPALVLGSWP